MKPLLLLPALTDSTWNLYRRCFRNNQRYSEDGQHSCHTKFLRHVDLLSLIPDGVGVVEPAVVLVAHFAVCQREALVSRLGQHITILHLDQLKVAAVLLTRLLLRSLECSALHAISVEIHTGG